MPLSKIDLFILLEIGLFTFLIIFIRLGYIFGTPINIFTLPVAFVFYSICILCFISFLDSKRNTQYVTLCIFVVLNLIISACAFLFAQTYDSSWDGQGYHQSAVIALATGWNPIWHSSIDFLQKLPSQIFAEGYPPAFWELEASFYAVWGKINAAKVLNLYFALIACLTWYSLLRRIHFRKILAGIISFLVILQPVYLLQFLTFMQDGLGYQLVLIAIASLVIFILTPKAYWAIMVFFFSELFLVSTKYSQLPLAVVLGVIALLVIGNRLLNKVYKVTPYVKSVLVGLILVSVLFAHLPYIRNFIAHGAMFFPTNEADLMGSVKYNNVPNNLSHDNKFVLLFYGIFSRAQDSTSGDPRAKQNIAELKIPFTTSIDEVTDSVSLYNNRAGAGGPLFSGIVVVSILFLFVMSFKAQTQKERYAMYASYLCLLLLLALALATPTPNLLRYVNQLQLIPFAVLLPIYAVFFHKKYVIAITYSILLLVMLNTVTYAYAVTQHNIMLTNTINQQFDDMRKSKATYKVGAQQFYSNYVLLNEQQIPIVVEDKLECKKMEKLVFSSTTTAFCKK